MITNTFIDDDAYLDGMMAQTRGVDRTQCPYCPETSPLKYIWWGIGWDDSETESKKQDEQATLHA